MAYTLDDIKKIKNRRGTASASSSDSQKYSLEDVKRIGGRQSVGNSIMQSAPSTPTAPTYRYNSIEEYDKALGEKPKGYTAKGLYNGLVDVLNSGVGGVVGGTVPNLQRMNFTQAEKDYADLKTERNLYAMEHAFDPYKKYQSNADYAKKSQESIEDYLKILDSNNTDQTYSKVYNAMTDEEKAMANYLASNNINMSLEESNRFKDYMMNMRAMVDKRSFDQKVADANKYVDEGGSKLGLSAKTVGENLVSSIGTGGEYLASYLGGWTPNPYGGASGLGNLAMEEREAVSKNMGDTGRFLYNTGMSIADSALGAFTFGEGYAYLMGTNAFNTTYRDLYERGASQDEILTGALGAGIAEALFEKVSLENLLSPKNISGWKSWLKQTAKQAGVEASEEFFTEISNIITDEMTQGANSEIARMVSEMQAQGRSEEDIKAELSKVIAKRIGEAALGGLISGGVMGGGVNALNYARSSDLGKYTDREALYNKANEMGGEVASTASTYGENLKNATNAEVGALVSDAYEQASKTGRDAYEQALIDSFENLGLEHGEALELKDAIVAEKRTKLQNALIDNAMVRDVIDEVNRTYGEQMAIDARNAMVDVADVIQDKRTIKALDKAGVKIDSRTTVKGEDAKIKDVTLEEGKVVATTDKGEAETLSKNDASLVSYALGMDNEFKRRAFLANYDGQQNVTDYAESFNLAYTYGKMRLGEDSLRNDLGITINLPVETAVNAYIAGESENSKVADSLENTVKDITPKGLGKGTLDKSEVNIKDLTSTQRAYIAVGEMFTNLGINVKFINNPDSKSLNGSYENGVVTINLSARISPNMTTFDTGYVLNTMAHELTHWMKDANDGGFEALKNTIFTYFGEEKVKDLVAKEQQSYEKKHGKPLKPSVAEEEVVARACEDMLSNQKTFEDILMSTDEATRKTILDKFKEFLDRIGEFIQKVLKIDSRAEAATLLRKDMEVFEEVRQLWVKTFNDAVKNIQSSEETLNNANIEIEDGIAYNAKTLDESWLAASNESEVKKVGKILADSVDVSQEKAEEYVKNLHTVASIEATNKYLQYEDTGMSSWVSNSDYGANFDFSYLCPKRLVYTGTVAEIRKKFNKPLTPTRFLAIRRFLINRNHLAPCSFCYVESGRVNADKYILDFISKNKQYGLSLAQLSDADFLEDLRREWVTTGKDNGYRAFEKYMNKLSQRKPKALEKRRAYRGEILKSKDFNDVEKINRNRGLRFFAFSDFEVPHMLDLMQVITDMSVKRLAGFAYTKQTAFVEVFGGTGLKINMSCVAKGVDENGNIIFDDVEGMNSSDAIRLREKYSQDVGIVCVVFTDEQVRAAMADDRIDYILPFHRSQYNKEMYSMMGLPADTKDFTKEQTEKQGDESTKRTESNIPVADFWDYTKSGRENAQTYLDIINERGMTPLFKSALEYEGGGIVKNEKGKNVHADGKWVLPEGKVGDGYYKLLIEQKMFDNDGNAAPQRPVMPDFDMEAATKIASEFDENPNTFPVAQDVVEDFLAWEKKGEPLFSDKVTDVSNEVDSEGNELSEEQIEFFKKSQARDAFGRLKRYYHGTRHGGFTIFERTDDHLSYFFTDNIKVASSYSGVGWVMNPDEPMTYDEVSALMEGGDVGDLRISANGYVLYPYSLEGEEEEIRFKDLKEALKYYIDEVATYEAEQNLSQPTNYAVYLNATNPLVIDGGRKIEGKIQKVNIAPYRGRYGFTFYTELGDFSEKVRAKDVDSYLKETFGDRYEEVKSLVKQLRPDGDTAYEDNEPKYNVVSVPDVDVSKIFSSNWTSISHNGRVGNTRAWAKYAADNGYDSLIFNNIMDNGGHTDNVFESSQVVVVFNPNQIKSVYNENPTTSPDIRYSIKDDGFVEKDSKTLAYTNDRIDKLLSGGYYGATNPDYAQAYVAYMSPDDFLKLTTGKNQRALGRIKEWMGDYYEEYRENFSFDKMADEYNYQPILLNIDEEEREVTNHEGRHRMWQLKQMGYNRIPVLLFNMRNKYEKKPIDSIDLMPQWFNSEDDALNDSDRVTVKDLLPFSQGNRELIKQKFGEEAQADTYFSDKIDTDSLDLFGQYEKFKKQNEALKADVERLKKRLKLEGTLTKGRVMKDKDLENVAISLLKSANSKAAKAEVIEGLRDVYGYILDNSNSGQIDYDIMMSKAYDVASTIMSKAKPMKIVDDYYKGILQDIRSAKIKLTPEQIQEAKNVYGEDYRKALFGRINTVNSGRSLDSYWSEWAEMYPNVFDVDTNPNDQITELSSIYDMVKEASELLMYNNTVSDIMYMAEEVYNKFWNVRTETTTADKHEAEIKRLKFEHRQAMDKVKSENRQKLNDQQLADRMYYGKVIERMRQKHKAELKDIREYRKQKEAQRKDAAERRALIVKITNVSKDLATRLAKNSTKNPVPEPIKVPLGNLLSAIDYSSQQLLGLRSQNAYTETKADVAMSTLLNKVKASLADVSEDENKTVDLAGLHLPINFTTDLEEIAVKLQSAEDAAGEHDIYTLQLMDTEDLNALYKVIKGLKTAITNLNKIISSNNAHDVDYIGNEIIEYLREIGARKIDNRVTQFLDIASQTPYYYFKHLGKGGQELFRLLQDGWDKLADNVEDISKFTHETYKAEEVEKWKNTTHTFEIGNRTITMTESQIMSLYCLSKREHAMGHIKGKGIVIDEIKTKRKYGKHEIKRQDALPLTDSDLAEILKVVENDAEMKRVADAIQKFMNTVCSDWGNEVTLKLYGINIFGEKNYFPIHVNQDVLKSEAQDKGKSIYGMLNQSFAKPLTEGAQNEINVADIFDVFTTHASDMAKYNALALPVLDVIKVWNYQEENGDNVDAVKKSITKAIGEKGNAYIGHLLRDINGDMESGRYDKLTMQFAKKYKTAAVAANIQTALLQPLSYIRASYVMSPKYLRQALLRKPKIEKCLNNVGVAKWKSMGFHDTNLSRGLDKIISNTDTKAETWVDKTLWLTEKMDEITWGYLYTAVELETKEKYPTLTGAKLDEQVASRLRDVLYATQVFDATLSRSDIMRSGSALVQMETAFLAEPTLHINMLMDAATEYNYEVRRNGKESARKKYGKLIARAGLVYLISSIAESVLRGVIKKIRDYDDIDEKEFEGLFEDVLKRTLEELNPLGKLPIIKDFISLMQGYNLTNMNEEFFNTGLQAYQAILKSIENGELTYKTVFKIASAMSQFTGLPISNTIKEFKTVWNNTIGRATGLMIK